MDQKMLDMYKKMVKRQKHKRITRNDYDTNHNYNNETNEANYERE